MGVLALGWSILEVVAYLWLEGVVLVLVGAAWAVANRRWLALLVVPPYLLATGALLALQLLLLTLAFFVLRFEEGFFEVLAEGERVARGVLWGAALVAAWHAVGFALRLREGRPRTRRAMGHAAVHVLVLTVFSLASVAIVRDLHAPALALALVVALKMGLDVGVHAAGRRWPALAG